jgi:hypothetical protein
MVAVVEAVIITPHRLPSQEVEVLYMVEAVAVVEVVSLRVT